MSLPANSSGVAVTDLAKAYDGAQVLRGVSFGVRPGEILGVLGRNGAGKTTLLECILGLRQPDRGEVAIAGIDARLSPAAARELLGAQLQAAALQDKITPTQALRYFASFYPRARPIGDLLAEFRLEEKASAPFDRLSGGQKQRLFLALAFVHDPAVVILDEPTAGLDPQARHELHACIVAAKARGVAVVLSTHDLDEAEQLCDRVAILHAGEIVATGQPAALIASSRRKPRLIVTTTEPLAAIQLGSLGGNVVSIAVDAPHTSAGEGGAPRTHRAAIECVDVDRALAAILDHLMSARNRLVQVQILRPTLEDVYFEHTGSAWSELAEGRAGTPLPAIRTKESAPNRRSNPA